MEEKKILGIVKNPNKVLRKKAAHVAVGDIRSREIQRLISEMKTTLVRTPDGVGLAAPQIGKSLAIFIVSEETEEIDKAQNKGWERHNRNKPEGMNERPYEKRDWKYYAFINPVVKNTSRRKLDVPPEGCLSVPGVFGTVARHEKITVEAYDETGKKFTRGASRFFARVIQHELDHLAGTLFIDKADELLEIEKDKTEKQ